MVKYFEAERFGQWVGLAGMTLVVALGVFAIAMHEPGIGAIAILVGAGPGVIWALRKRSDGPPPTDLSDPESSPSDE